MARRIIHWVNTPVLTEAILRYREGRLSRSMRLWVENLLDIQPQKSSSFLSKESGGN